MEGADEFVLVGAPPKHNLVKLDNRVVGQSQNFLMPFASYSLTRLWTKFEPTLSNLECYTKANFQSSQKAKYSIDNMAICT